jgi:5-methylcytosine-specific restriction enzyme A
MSRTPPEWIGKTPDTKVPPHVRMRIFLRDDGKCHITGRKIVPADYWDLEHRIALCNGGEHRESNLAPALRDAHRIKTRDDVAEKAKVDRIRKKHLGIKKPRTITAWRKMDGTAVYAPRER